MQAKNIVVLIGNGFDIANGFKTKFSDFADSYIDTKIIPALEEVIIKKNSSNIFFRKSFINAMITKGSAYSYENSEDALWLHTRNGKREELKSYIIENYQVLGKILNNRLLGKLYSSRDKNWFDIENTYFKELVEIKNQALINKTKQFNYGPLRIINKEFSEIKKEVLEYLSKIEISIDTKILQFFIRHFHDVSNVYFINFNYTNTLKLYTNKVNFDGSYQINHIHGDLDSGKIVFGYGNDQNDDYREIKMLEEDEFLRYFKTFDYLNNSNYDKVNDEAIDKFSDYEVYILGHSLGATDKTLLSEILNSDKCKKIRFFKRTDLENHPSLIQSNFRELTYAASRILTNERELRRKIVNFEDSVSFP
ncbi:AbiH family protein [Christiangramia echinicola]|uniref:Bacteriophage abortive infection AbiH n=1 Tax=Christiangramia echinicola TaxID=279359 RepID=A0A1H1L9M1_9FLAO|nr:AbiH family protein [Christiangramia echinicola]SDR71117.1 Bacteriophage abortive infection AbiH [Christiangramia echinicola]